MEFSCKLNHWRAFKIWLGAAALAVIGIVLAFVIDPGWIPLIIGFGFGLILVIWNIGPLFFQPRLEIHADTLKRRDFKYWGYRVDEVSVPFSKIAMVKKEEGIFFGRITVETSGGERDLEYKELLRADCRKAAQILETKRAQKEAQGLTGH
ncbi:MAG: hypothetical protein HRF49_06845 [bacterium]|jgi:hypothetical protein